MSSLLSPSFHEVKINSVPLPLVFIFLALIQFLVHGEDPGKEKEEKEEKRDQDDKEEDKNRKIPVPPKLVHGDWRLETALFD